MLWNEITGKPKVYFFSFYEIQLNSIWKDDYVLWNNFSPVANPFHRDVCIFTVNNASWTWKHIFVHCSWKSTLVNQCSNLFLRVGKLHLRTIFYVVSVRLPSLMKLWLRKDYLRKPSILKTMDGFSPVLKIKWNS